MIEWNAMNHRFSPWMIAALVLTLVVPACAQLGASQKSALQHLAPDSMSASDQAALRAHRRELAEAARIYGYNLAAGNWSYEQTLCAPMPDTVLLHYTQQFPDRTESLFTALVPRRSGHVHIVPVLYRSATPFVPAPENPNNYAIFNELAVKSTSGNAGTARNWSDLGACYAEMTGGHIDLYSNPEESIGIAGAPSPRLDIDAKDKTARVTVASREGVSTYKVWSISFNRNGRVTAASTEDQSVAVARVVQQATTPGTQSQQRSEPTYRQPAAQAASAGKTEPAANTQTATAVPQASSPGSETASAAAEQASDAPGWKYVLHSADPPSKIVPPAPPPPQKVIPEPPNAWEQPTQTPQ